MDVDGLKAFVKLNENPTTRREAKIKARCLNGFTNEMLVT